MDGELAIFPWTFGLLSLWNFSLVPLFSLSENYVRWRERTKNQSVIFNSNPWNIFAPQFSKVRVLRKNKLKDNKHNSLHLAQKYAQIFVLEHYLFLEAHSFLKLRVSWETVCLSKHWLSAEKYPSICPLYFWHYNFHEGLDVASHVTWILLRWTALVANPI